MKQVPKVLVIGRPNVGKSTFINRILNQYKAITLDEPGVTRDISSYYVEWKKKAFLILDSGGLVLEDNAGMDFQKEIEQLVKKQLDYVSHILFLVDFHTGIHPYDQVIANFIRPYAHKLTIVVNKVDDFSQKDLASDFFKLGFDTLFPVSAKNAKGLKPLLDAVVSGFAVNVDDDDAQEFKVCFTGRPNVGKSSLVNALVKDDRVLVSDVAGTTRDSVDVYFNSGKHHYLFVDTAGIRRTPKIEDGVEYYSVLRSKKTMDEVDLIVVVIDAVKGLTNQDKRIVNKVIDAKKNMVVFINKWDEMTDQDMVQNDFKLLLSSSVPALAYYPFIFGSAKENKNVNKLFTVIPSVMESGALRVPTADLNRFVENVIKRNPPPAKFGKRVKIYYGTQVESSPPGFVFFVNHPQLINPEYVRYLEKRIRQYFGGYEGNTIDIRFKGHRAEQLVEGKD